MIQKASGTACKSYREKIILSQEKFAIQIGMDRTYYASVEAVKRNISIQNIKKIADGFNIHVLQLLKKAKNYFEWRTYLCIKELNY